MYRALITDLDGTAVPIRTHGESVDDPTRQSVKQAQARGFHISCATGRTWRSAKPVVEALGLKSLCIIEGGTSIIDSRSEEIRWRKLLDEGMETEIFKIFRQMSKDGWLLVSEDLKPRPIRSVQSLKPDLSFMYLMGLSENLALKIAQKINSSALAVAHTTTPSWYGDEYHDVHVTHPEATKEHAIKVWHSLEGVSVEETIGMGDSGNDLPLFKSAGLKVAVSNALPSLKELADYIAPGVNEQALKHVIDKFLLSQK